MIQQTLASDANSRTIVCVTHRLSTIKHADNIIVLSDGKIVAEGTHVELIAKEGMYKQLVEAQQIYFEDEESRVKCDDEVQLEKTEDATTTHQIQVAVSDTTATFPRPGGNNVDDRQRKSFSNIYLLKQVCYH